MSISRRRSPLLVTSPNYIFRILLSQQVWINQVNTRIIHSFFALFMMFQIAAENDGLSKWASKSEWRIYASVLSEQLSRSERMWREFTRGERLNGKPTTCQSRILSGPRSATTSSVCSCCHHSLMLDSSYDSKSNSSSISF